MPPLARRIKKKKEKKFEIENTHRRHQKRRRKVCWQRLGVKCSIVNVPLLVIYAHFRMPPHSLHSPPLLVSQKTGLFVFSACPLLIRLSTKLTADLCNSTWHASWLALTRRKKRLIFHWLNLHGSFFFSAVCVSPGCEYSRGLQNNWMLLFVYRM